MFPMPVQPSMAGYQMVVGPDGTPMMMPTGPVRRRFEGFSAETGEEEQTLCGFARARASTAVSARTDAPRQVREELLVMLRPVL